MDSFLIQTDTFQLSSTDFIIRLLVALGIGAIIGLEREHAATKENSPSFAGIRTFVSIVLLGFLGGLTYYILGMWVYIAIVLSAVILTGISYFITASKGDIGAATEFSLLITFFLGTLSFMGMLSISLLITVLVLVLLSAKIRLRTWVGKITPEELYDFIRYVVIALLIFPFLPNKTIDPWEVINPHEVGWVILLTSGLGFVGYVLMRILGSGKGILLSGFVGGLISSTAVTWVFSKKSKKDESLSLHCGVAILAASTMMVVRVGVWTYLFNPSLMQSLIPAIALVLLTGLGITFFYYLRQKNKTIQEEPIRQGKPLDLRGALVFGALYMAILLSVSYANSYLGDRGLLISSAIAGFSDIDAISITVGKLSLNGLALSLAAQAILIATLSNSLVKLGIGLWAGSKTLRKILLWGYGAMIIALVIGLWIS
ncbi:MgtC/SapB family protein [Cytophagales bacterium LB-30]|uniref:MgtC/SapB family protein n=1 Tax=Shiella aurantiaca TaxID=3058365 RepID=A0ABT8F204_9BACT|nr:MgtC/SapB family protein [Shiella aurantiaca]MDN4164475.1 MgtC/SapB family protein [Shiella aurantiaca]